jgi:hypothetical protein
VKDEDLLKRWLELTEEVWEKRLICLQSGDIEENHKEHFINSLVWIEKKDKIMVGICHSEPTSIKTPSTPFQWVRK